MKDFSKGFYKNNLVKELRRLIKELLNQEFYSEELSADDYMEFFKQNNIEFAPDVQITSLKPSIKTETKTFTVYLKNNQIKRFSKKEFPYILSYLKQKIIGHDGEFTFEGENEKNILKMVKQIALKEGWIKEKIQ